MRVTVAKMLLGLVEAPTKSGAGYDVTALSGVGPPVYEARGRSVIVVYHVDHASQRVLPIRWVLYY